MRNSRKNSFAFSVRSKASFVRSVILRYVVGLMVTAVMFGIFATPSAVGLHEPCEKCPPGAHWIDNCGPGQDQIPDQGGIVEIDLDLNCQTDLTIVLNPCGVQTPLVIDRSGPLDDSHNFPGLRPVDGHLDVIDTEILSMCLTGSGFTLRAGLGQGGVINRSLGAVAEKVGDPTVGESFFDVFFVVETPQ